MSKSERGRGYGEGLVNQNSESFKKLQGESHQKNRVRLNNYGIDYYR
jgi:hypothetical protein